MFDAKARRAMLILALTVAPPISCGRIHTGADSQVARVIFKNESMDQAAVYVVSRTGARMRIGTVMAGMTDTLKVQRDLLASGGGVNIVASIFARSRTAETGPVTMVPGGIYLVRLGPDERTLSFLLAQ